LRPTRRARRRSASSPRGWRANAPKQFARSDRAARLYIRPMSTPSSSQDESSPRYFGWRVVVACFLMALACWGFGLYGHSVYLAELQRLHGWPPSLIAGASTATYLLNAVARDLHQQCARALRCKALRAVRRRLAR